MKVILASELRLNLKMVLNEVAEDQLIYVCSRPKSIDDVILMPKSKFDDLNNQLKYLKILIGKDN